MGIPTIACGGVSRAEHALKMIMSGAIAVEVYSAAHLRGVRAASVFTEINKGLTDYLDNWGVKNIMDLRSKAVSLLDQQNNIQKHIPQVLENNCTGCDKCLAVCLPQSFRLRDFPNKAKHIVTIDQNSCVGCGHCVSVCPSNALN